MPRASVLWGAAHGRMAQPGQMVLMTLILWQNLLSPRRATRSMSTSSLPVQGSGLVMVAILMMESRAGMPSVPPYEKTLDDDNYHLVLGALPHHGARHSSLAHLGMAKGGTESHHDLDGAPARPTPAPLPRQEEYGIPQQPQHKVQFRSHHRRQMKDIYTYIEMLQCLIDLALPFMDYHAKQETVTNHFLLRMGNHELSLQVAAHGHRGVEDI